MRKIKGKKYVAVFLIKEQQSYSVVFKIRFNPTNKILSYKKRSYPIKIDFPTYIIGLKLYYFIEINRGQIIFDKTKDPTMDPKLLDMLISQEIISQLTDNLSGNAFKMSLYNILIGVVMGALGGYIAGGIVI